MRLDPQRPVELAGGVFPGDDGGELDDSSLVESAGNPAVEVIVHVAIGKKSFEPDKLVDNASALLEVVIKAKPAAAKGTYLKKIAVSTTMGPGLRVDPGSPLSVQAA